MNQNSRRLSNEKRPLSNTTIIIEPLLKTFHQRGISPSKFDKNNNNLNENNFMQNSFESLSNSTQIAVDPCPLMSVSTISSISSNTNTSKNSRSKILPNSSTTMILNEKCLKNSKLNCSLNEINSPLVQPFQYNKMSYSSKFQLNTIDFDEQQLIHERMERVQAEQLLNAMQIGDYLLRRRNEGNLALSLRSVDG